MHFLCRQTAGRHGNLPYGLAKPLNNQMSCMCMVCLSSKGEHEWVQPTLSCVSYVVRGHWVKHFRLSFPLLPPFSSSCGIRHCEAFPSFSCYSKKIYAAISPFIFNHNRRAPPRHRLRGPIRDGAHPRQGGGAPSIWAPWERGGRCRVFLSGGRGGY